MNETKKQPTLSVWQTLRNIGVVPLGLSAVLGAPSYLDILAYFFDDLHYGVLVERMLDNWRLINRSITEIVSPLTGKLLVWMQSFYPDLVLSDVWLSFFWIMLIPCFAFYKGLVSQPDLKLDTGFGMKVLFGIFFGIPVFLISFIAGIVPNPETIFGQIFQAVAPILALPFALFVSFFIFSLIGAAFLIFFNSKRVPLSKRVANAYSTFFGSLSHVIPTPRTFLFPLKLSFVFGVTTALLSYINYPENRPALFVYFCALIILGFFLLFVKPSSPKVNESGETKENTDVRPIGGIILGGGLAAALIVTGEFIFTSIFKGVLQ